MVGARLRPIVHFWCPSHSLPHTSFTSGGVHAREQRWPACWLTAGGEGPEKSCAPSLDGGRGSGKLRLGVRLGCRCRSSRRRPPRGGAESSRKAGQKDGCPRGTHAPTTVLIIDIASFAITWRVAQVGGPILPEVMRQGDEAARTGDRKLVFVLLKHILQEKFSSTEA